MPSRKRLAIITGLASMKKLPTPRALLLSSRNFERVANVKDKPGLMKAIARVQDALGPNPLFNFYSSSDLHSANDVIAYIDQGGLSLPDRDYYLKDDPKTVAARKSFVEYATQLFTLRAGSLRSKLKNRGAVGTAY